MPTLYIASDRRGSGRTALAAGIASSLQQGGTGILLYKPLYLGEDSAPSGDPDVEDYRRLGLTLAAEPVPVRPQDLTRSLGQATHLQGHVEETFHRISQGQETVIVEGLPGLDPEHPTSRASGELAALLDARVIVVMAFTPGLQAETLERARGLFGERLLGVAINGIGRYQGHHTRTHLLPTTSERGVRVLGAIPEDRRLLGITVRDIAQALEGEIILGEEKAEDLVEHLMVGANFMDKSILYFEQRANKAVLVRGDRPDIQMGALATDTACLVLTGGKGPIQYVEYEAEQEEVALVRVPHSLQQAAQRLSGLLERARFDHPRKLERFRELLRQHLDWEALRAGLQP